VSEITTSSLFLTWDESVGDRYLFKLNWTNEKTANHVTTNNIWYNITDLTAGANYTFIITAVAADHSTEGESVVTSYYTSMFSTFPVSFKRIVHPKMKILS